MESLKDNKKRAKARDTFNLAMLDGMRGIGRYDLPELEPFNGPADSEPLPFNEAQLLYSKQKSLKGYFVHFYINDDRFRCLYNNPERYVDMLRSADFIVAPDYSVYRNFPFPVIIKNVFDNRRLARFYQLRGVNVVANVTWITPESYSYIFDGQPRGSVIAVNSNCIPVRDTMAVNLWKHGYAEAVRRLEPSLVLRYGRKIEGEETLFSAVRHFESPYFKFLRHGR